MDSFGPSPPLNMGLVVKKWCESKKYPRATRGNPLIFKITTQDVLTQ